LQKLKSSQLNLWQLFYKISKLTLFISSNPKQFNSVPYLRDAGWKLPQSWEKVRQFGIKFYPEASWLVSFCRTSRTSRTTRRGLKSSKPQSPFSCTVSHSVNSQCRTVKIRKKKTLWYSVLNPWNSVIPFLVSRVGLTSTWGGGTTIRDQIIKSSNLQIILPPKCLLLHPLRLPLVVLHYATDGAELWKDGKIHLKIL
jgi:hypothetical protein